MFCGKGLLTMSAVSDTPIKSVLANAVKTGTIAIKGCMEHIGQTVEEIVQLRQLTADFPALSFGVKIGGCSAKSDAATARNICDADFIIAPMCESVYAAKQARSIADANGITVDIMCESRRAIFNPDLWETMAFNARAVIFGLSDIVESGCDERHVYAPYAYLSCFFKDVPICIGGGMEPVKAERIVKTYPYAKFIETRHCRVDVAASKDIKQSVKNALLFEVEYYRLIGKPDLANLINERLNNGNNG